MSLQNWKCCCSFWRIYLITSPDFRILTREQHKRGDYWNSFVNVTLLIQISSVLLSANWRPVLQQNVKLYSKDGVMSTAWQNNKWDSHFLEIKRKLFTYIHFSIRKHMYVTLCICRSYYYCRAHWRIVLCEKHINVKYNNFRTS